MSNRMKYVHTNIIARDWKRLSQFYQKVFGCRPLAPRRDFRGEWLDRITGVPDAHVTGEHLALPGYDGDLPTLEIFSYDSMPERSKAVNAAGIAHLAFEVDDVAAVLQSILREGGGQIGKLVQREDADNVVSTFVYATDIEGNIIELQHRERRV
jgi:predicted enzyme related to lactoylglutathione lyase